MCPSKAPKGQPEPDSGPPKTPALSSKAWPYGPPWKRNRGKKRVRKITLAKRPEDTPRYKVSSGLVTGDSEQAG